jgi:hypothetical protein
MNYSSFARARQTMIRCAQIVSTLLFAFFCFESGASANQYSYTRNTLDALVANSDLVVRGTVTKREDLKVKDDQTYSGFGWVRISMAVAETLKGTAPGSEIDFLILDHQGPPAEHDRVPVGIEAIFGLKNVARDADAAAASASVAKSPRYLLPTVGDDGWPPGRNPIWFIPFNSNHDALTFETGIGALDWDVAKIRGIEGRAKICAAARRIAAEQGSEFAPVGKICSVDITRMDQRELDYMLIPIDARTRAAAEKWARSDDPLIRLRAVEFLSVFSDDAARNILRCLLDDPFSESARFYRHPFNYPVRERAITKLPRRKNLRLSERILTAPSIAMRSARPAWIVVIALAAILLISLAARKIGIARAAAVSLAVLVVCFWIPGLRYVEAMNLRIFGARHELSMAGGAIHYIHRADVPVGPFLSLGSVPRTAGMDAEWKDSIWKPAVNWHFGAFRAASGTAWQWGPCRLLALPAWLFLLPAIGIVLRAGFVRARAASRRRSGKCVRCGYDLRGTATGCPECGLQRVEAHTA